MQGTLGWFVPHRRLIFVDAYRLTHQMDAVIIREVVCGHGLLHVLSTL